MMTVIFGAVLYLAIAGIAVAALFAAPAGKP